MIHSDRIDALAVALCEAQGKFESVAKGSENPFFKSKYAALPDVVKAASPILAECGLAVSQLLGHDEQGDTLTTLVLHKSGQFIGDTMHLRPVKDDPQAQGSATTYGRRYSYMAALGLVADEDDDGNAGSTRPAAKPSRPKRSKGAEEGASGSEAGTSPPAPPPASPLPDNVLTPLRAMVERAGIDTKNLGWLLLQHGVEAPVNTEAEVAAAVPLLTVEKARELWGILEANAKERGAGE